MANGKYMEVKPDIETFAKILVVGVGGSGGSAVARMIQSGLKGVEFVAVNTDAQALHHNPAKYKIHIGKSTTRGLGAGMDPSVGAKAAEESQEDLTQLVKGADMVFITCGLGGGTGSGAGPLIAGMAHDAGALTVAVVTKPFAFEGEQRKQIAEVALNEMAEQVDTIITIPNDRLLQIIDKKTSLLDAFKTVDDVLFQGVQGISDLITVPGLINVDFADVKSVMSNAGSALMGIGKATGENRAVEAAKAAVDSPLLELDVNGARGILFTITGGSNLGMYEVNEAARVITESADPNAKIIFGANIDEAMGDEIKITVVATGFGHPGKATKKIQTVRPSPFSAATTTARSVISSKSDDKSANNMPAFRNKSILQEPPVDNSEDEDLEVPAFIRRKMM
ncbi:MAG: cell division protein FtsZ [Patescibacteria group bacterium]|jgi:cell division protein FtsZ